MRIGAAPGLMAPQPLNAVDGSTKITKVAIWIEEAEAMPSARSRPESSPTPPGLPRHPIAALIAA